MKRVFLGILLPLFFFASADGQILTSKEKKELKKEIKAYKKDVDSYKMMKEEYELNLQTIDDQAVTIESQKLQINRKDNTIKEQNDTIAYLRSLLAKGQPAQTDTRYFPEGTVYQVQVGVFQYFDIRAALENPKYFRTEEVDGMLRYSIGYFTDYEEAAQFKEDMRKMGLSDAFVTTYEDGQRTFEQPTIPGGYQPSIETKKQNPSISRKDSIEINTGYQQSTGNTTNSGTNSSTDEGKYEWIIVTDGKGNTGKVKRLKDDE
jgi:hypothetical protein